MLTRVSSELAKFVNVNKIIRGQSSLRKGDVKHLLEQPLLSEHHSDGDDLQPLRKKMLESY